MAKTTALEKFYWIAGIVAAIVAIAALFISRSSTFAQTGGRGIQIGENNGPITVQPPPPPPPNSSRSVTYTQKQIVSDDPRFPYETEITLSTSQELKEAAFNFFFTAPYEQAFAKFADGSPVAGTASKGGDEWWHLNLWAIFEPDMPLLIDVYAKRPVYLQSFERLN